MAYTWEVLSAIETVAGFSLSHSKKSFLLSYGWGLVFGLVFEISAEPLFDYQPIFAFYVWKDIPLAIVLGWGASIAGFQIVSDFVHRNRRIRNNTLKSIAADTFVSGILGTLMEYLGSHDLALWIYPASSVPLIVGMPVVCPLGWVVTSLGNLSLVRRLEAALNREMGTSCGGI